jgi:hypothetical protein
VLGGADHPPANDDDEHHYVKIGFEYQKGARATFHDPGYGPAIEFVDAVLVDADGLAPPPAEAQLDKWAIDYLRSDFGHCAACDEAGSAW